MYHVLCCRKRLAYAKWVNPRKHCHNVEALLETVEKTIKTSVTFLKSIDL